MNRPILIAARAALCVCALLTAWGAFAQPGQIHPHLFPWDKAEHFSAFFALTLCSLAAFPKTRLLWIALALSGCGALIEVVQAIPFLHRDSDVKDWIADTAAVAAVISVVIVARLRRGLA